MFLVGTGIRSRSSHTVLKSQYDALVIGGGEICELLEKYAECIAAVLQLSAPNFAISMQRYVSVILEKVCKQCPETLSFTFL